MPQKLVKLFKSTGKFDDDNELYNELITAVSDWEEVTNDQYFDLIDLIEYKNKNYRDYRLILIEPLPSEQIKLSLKEWKEKLKKDKEILETKRIKNKEAEKKRAIKREKKEQELFQKLKSKFDLVTKTIV